MILKLRKKNGWWKIRSLRLSMFKICVEKQMQESKAEGYNLATFVVDKYLKNNICLRKKKDNDM